MKAIKNAKLICAVLALVMTLSFFAACAETNGEGASDITTMDPANAAVTTGGDPEVTYVSDDLPELDFKGEDIVILARTRDLVEDEIVVDDENGLIINDAVYKRNELVNRRLNVEIKMQGVDGTATYVVHDALKIMIDTGAYDVDLVANLAYVTASTTASGLVRNLRGISTLDLTKPYWSQGLNEAMRVGDSQYIISGAALLSYYRFTFVTFFNVDMFENSGIPSLYDTVESGDWTIEKQIEYTKLLFKDNNGNGESDKGDVFGFMSNHNMIGVDAYWASCELPILTQNADGFYEYSLDIERTVKTAELLTQLFWDTEGTMRIPQTTGDTEQDEIAQRFASEEAAMVTLRLIEVENDLLGMSNYGIVPVPRLDSEQATYRSAIHDSFTTFSIPNFNFSEEELEMLGAVLEVMGSQSFSTITPAYYEQALKGRYANDPQSVRMLDLITQNVWIDAGVLYCNAIDKPHQMMRTIVGNNASNISSQLSAKARIVTKQVAALNTELEKLLG